MEWFQKGAELGSIISMRKLGINYHEGIGVAIDVDKGLEWLNRAAKLGYKNAQNYLNKHATVIITLPLDIFGLDPDDFA